jgi:predicted ArsR family transcriptional regulator
VAPAALESRTRDRILQVISERGPITAATLAMDLGLTAPAVRRHLENLEDAGLIAAHEVAPGVRGRGRPARSFVLSDAGHQGLESDYDHLATEALRFISQESGEGAVRRFAELVSPSSRAGMPRSWLLRAPAPLLAWTPWSAR